MALARRLASSQPWLDRLADRTQPRVRNLLEQRKRLHDLLDGTWLGVPLHPALTDLPIGSWVSALTLDSIASLTGSPAAARGADAALAIGTAGAVPAALTGIGDWRDLHRESRRMHGVLNTAGLALSAASLAQRARGRPGSGRALSATGLIFSGLAAHLGGELSFSASAYA